MNPNSSNNKNKKEENPLVDIGCYVNYGEMEKSRKEEENKKKNNSPSYPQ